MPTAIPTQDRIRNIYTALNIDLVSATILSNRDALKDGNQT
jgi:hypothetical protein